MACCIMHNWVLQDGLDDFIIQETNYIPNHNYVDSSSGQASEHQYMINFRHGIVIAMWQDHQNDLQE